MPDHSTLTEVKDLLASGQTEAAADLLLKLADHFHEDYHQDALLLKNRLESLQKNSIEGVLSQSDESIEWARIARGIVGLVDNIEKGERPKDEAEIRAEARSDGKHQLAAVMFTDIVGFTGLMRQDEGLAVASVKRHKSVLESCTAAEGGQVLQYYGDGSLSIFQSAFHAVRCAVEVQKQFRRPPAVPLRIGIHIGEILWEGGNVFGDGVNVASRIESLGTAGAVLFSKEVHRKVRNRPEFKTASLGSFDFKGVGETMEVFALCNEDFPVPKREEMQGKLAPPKPEARIFSTGKLVAAVLFGILVAVASLVFFYETPAGSNSSSSSNSNLNEVAEVPMDTYRGKVVFAFDNSPAAGAVVNLDNGMAIDTTGPDGGFEVSLSELMRDSMVYLQIFYGGERKVAHEIKVGDAFFEQLKIHN